MLFRSYSTLSIFNYFAAAITKNENHYTNTQLTNDLNINRKLRREELHSHFQDMKRCFPHIFLLFSLTFTHVFDPGKRCSHIFTWYTRSTSRSLFLINRVHLCRHHVVFGHETKSTRYSLLWSTNYTFYLQVKD